MTLPIIETILRHFDANPAVQDRLRMRLEKAAGARRRMPPHELARSPEFLMLVAIAEMEGTLPNFNQTTLVHGMRLGRWVNHIRRHYYRGTLPETAVTALQALPGWRWRTLRTRAPSFLERVEAVLAFLAHRNPPTIPARERRLAPTLAYVRTLYRAGTLDPAIATRFEALPGWTWTPRERTAKAVTLLQAFLKEGGSLASPTGAVFRKQTITRVVAEVRRQYRKNQLRPQTIAELEALSGWSWGPSDEVAVAERGHRRNTEGWLPILQKFVEREGHARVPHLHLEGKHRLGQWVHGRRDAWRNGLLDSAEITRLESVPGWSWQPAAERPAPLTLEEQVAGVESHPFGGTLIRASDPTLPDDIVERIRSLRRLHRAGELPRKLVRRLEDVTGWTWSDVEAIQEEVFLRLESFGKRFGRIPGVREVDFDGYLVGRRAERLRGLYRKKLLPPASVKRLERLPGWTWENPQLK